MTHTVRAVRCLRRDEKIYEARDQIYAALFFGAVGLGVCPTTLKKCVFAVYGTCRGVGW